MRERLNERLMRCPTPGEGRGHWIPACAGMTEWGGKHGMGRHSPLDSRLRGNDGVGRHSPLDSRLRGNDGVGRHSPLDSRLRGNDGVGRHSPLDSRLRGNDGLGADWCCRSPSVGEGKV